MADNRYVKWLRYPAMVILGSALLWGWWSLMSLHSMLVLYAMLAPLAVLLSWSLGWAVWNLLALGLGAVCRGRAERT